MKSYSNYHICLSLSMVLGLLVLFQGWPIFCKLTIGMQKK